MTGGPYYTVAEVARRFGVSARWLADECRAGRVEHVYIARKRRFTEDQVARLAQHNTVTAAGATRHAAVQANALRRLSRASHR